MKKQRKQTPIVCVANSKGGVGKTQTIVELCAHLSGKQILVCDMDPQGSSTRRLLGLKEDEELEENQLTIFDLLVNPSRCKIQELILGASESFPHVDIMPSDVELSNVSSHLNGKLGFERRLADQLDRIKDNYDLILIDTGPQITMLTSIALRATTAALIIPTDTSRDGIFGINELNDVVEALKDVNHHIDKRYIILTASQKQKNKSNRTAKETLLHKYHDAFLSDLEFPHSVRVTDSVWTYPPVAAQQILEKNHKLYKSYGKLAKMIIS